MLKNLWGDLSDLKTVRTPVAILKEQGQFLSQSTDGILLGVVHDEYALVSGRFLWEFRVEVPTLNNYRYTILTVSHTLDFYPLRVTAPRLDRTFECDDEPSFEKALQEILSSEEIRTVLSRLLSQARE